jgi:hypothetical protein
MQYTTRSFVGACEPRYPGCAPREAASRRMNAKQFRRFGQGAISSSSLARCRTIPAAVRYAAHISCSLLASTSLRAAHCLGQRF